MNLTPEMENEITGEIAPTSRLEDLRTEYYSRLPVGLRFRPKEDITAYELARVLEEIGVVFDSDRELKGIGRHFSIETIR